MMIHRPATGLATLLWIVPPLVFLFLFSGIYWMWRETRNLSFQYIRNESENTAEIILLQLSDFLYERNKDLSHLASLWEDVSPKSRSEKFLRDATGIISRENTFYAITYIDSSGNIVLRSSLQTNDSAVPLTDLDLKPYLDSLKIYRDSSITSHVFLSSQGDSLIALLKPVFEKQNDSSVFSGAVTGTLILNRLLPMVISSKIQQNNNIVLYVNGTMIFNSRSSSDTSSNRFSQENASGSLKSWGRIWKVSVSPHEEGLLKQLLDQNNQRFFINMIASAVVTIFIGLIIQLLYRSRFIRMRLEKSEQRYRRLAENSPDMIFRMSLPEGRYEYVSPAAEMLTGYSPVNFYKDSLLLTKIVDPYQRENFQKKWEELFKGIISNKFEYRIIHKNGSHRWLHQRNVVIFSKEETPIALEGIINDTTTEKNAILERDKLIKELEIKNDDLERFTYTISHELKTPLITIKGFLGYLEEEATKGDISQLHQDVLRIIKATETMQRLLNALIDLTRIGRITQKPEPVDIHSIITSVIKSYSKQIKRQNVSVEIVSQLPNVMGYREELFELFHNLIGNSLKFMGDQSEPHIKIGTYLSDNETIFYVQDNGIGIDPRYQERIFGLFDKLQINTEGTGAGLAIVKRIIFHHNGWIKAESKGIGKGTLVSFKLLLT